MADASRRKDSARASPTLFDRLDSREIRIVPAAPEFVAGPPPADEPAASAAAETATEEPLARTQTRTRRTAKRKSAPSAAPARRRAATRGRHKGPRTAEALAAGQREISVSEFFAKNRHLLGFDNKRKALLTTVKEAVDNSLDACEEARVLPEIHVRIDQLDEDRFRVSVRDNGPGIVRSQIPNIFGKLLYGSKFHRLKMSRGQQGIGISAAGMYGLLTTGRSVMITSRTGPRSAAHHFEIQIDTSRNRPQVVRDETVEVPWERGTEVQIELVGSYSRGRTSIDEYIEQTAIANPHAQITYAAPDGQVREFPRGCEELPAEPREIQPHPHGIELGVLMKMLKDTRSRTLGGFLQSEFCRVSSRVAQQICEKARLNPNARPARIAMHEAETLYQAIQQTRIIAPPTDCLAPIGVRSLLAGLLKEVRAEFYTATTRNPAVYRGNPFQIEVALAYGGQLPGDQPARVIRFANRVPLLYQQSACCTFRAVLDVDWRNYGLSQPTGSLPVGPLVVLVHMASVWVPFTSESKEAIADYDEIRREIRLALQECGRKLAAYIRRRRRQKLEADKRDIFERYIPDVAEALANLTGASTERLMRDLRAIARARTAEADVVLDEEGRPIRTAADDAPADDETTVIVAANAATEVTDNLFEPSGNGNGTRRPRKRRRKR